MKNTTRGFLENSGSKIVESEFASYKSSRELKSQANPLVKLKDMATLQWLKKRFANKISHEYLFNDSERQRYTEIKDIFNKFDVDGGGQLDMKELYNLLKKSSLNFTKKTIEEVFRLLDTDGSGYLSVEEFQTLIMDHSKQKQFRDIMKEVKDDTLTQQGSKSETDSSIFVPLTFEALLHYLFTKENRD